MSMIFLPFDVTSKNGQFLFRSAGPDAHFGATFYYEVIAALDVYTAGTATCANDSADSRSLTASSNGADDGPSHSANGCALLSCRGSTLALFYCSFSIDFHVFLIRRPQAFHHPAVLPIFSTSSGD